MFSHLLIATDGSKLAKVAINNGVRFAKAIGARVTGFYAAPVYDPRVYEDFSAVGYLSPEEYRKQIAQLAERQRGGGEAKSLPAPALFAHRIRVGATDHSGSDIDFPCKNSNRWSCPPALLSVPDMLKPPNGSTPTNAPVHLRLK